MRLPAGTRLGPYQLLGLLGAGGMAEVCKAKDTRLDRTVVIKVLSLEFAGRPDLRERFEREARAVAALNHPHICDLHDVGETPNPQPPSPESPIPNPEPIRFTRAFVSPEATRPRIWKARTARICEAYA